MGNRLLTNGGPTIIVEGGNVLGAVLVEWEGCAHHCHAAFAAVLPSGALTRAGQAHWPLEVF